MTECVSVLAGQLDHAGIPEMSVQPEEDDLCCPSGSVNPYLGRSIS